MSSYLNSSTSFDIATRVRTALNVFNNLHHDSIVLEGDGLAQKKTLLQELLVLLAEYTRDNTKYKRDAISKKLIEFEELVAQKYDSTSLDEQHDATMQQQIAYIKNHQAERGLKNAQEPTVEELDTVSVVLDMHIDGSYLLDKIEDLHGDYKTQAEQVLYNYASILWEMRLISKTEYGVILGTVIKLLDSIMDNQLADKSAVIF